MSVAVLVALSDIVAERRRKRMAGHVLRLLKERPASMAMDWIPEYGRRRRGRPRKTWRRTAREDLEEMESLETRTSGGDSLPNVPIGTGGNE